MNLKKLTLYSSVFALQGLSNAVIPILPELAGGDSGDFVISSLIFSGYFIGAFLALVPLGVLADRIGNLKVIRFGMLLTTLAGFVITFSDIPLILGIFRFLEGVGCGAFFPAAFSIIAEWDDSQQSLGEFNFLLNAGLAAGVFFSGMFAGFGIKTAIASFTFLAGLSCLFLLSKVGELLSPNRYGKEFTHSGYKIHANSQQDTSLLSELKSYLVKSRKTMFQTNFGKIWGISVLLYGATGLLNSNYADYSASFLTKPELGLAISVSYLAAMLSSLIAGRADINSKNIVRTGIILAAAGIFLSVKLPLLAFFLIGAGGGAAVVGLITAVSSISSSGFVMGLFNTGIYAGLGLGPVLGSLFLGPLGYETLFFVSAVALLSVFFVKLT
ncbi:putative permease [Methanosarcina barkeri str. Wiesmoor]|uniref:Multidrug efflux protein n=2 Tax=Methanosarcina barkeri TaxID=2208 RepID=Q46G24_METBF|nr:MFS transporter [Methanosarcina barkeri]AKB50067.1 putative permease [Methanosarcina barkeri str. Wiesmoor]